MSFLNLKFDKIQDFDLIKVNKIYNEDCLKGMRKIPDHSINMILCDLPYGTTELEWDSVIPLFPLWKQYQRIIKHNGAIVLTASQPFTTTLINSKPDWFKYNWVWEKSIVGDIFNAKNKPLKKHEDILVFSSGTTANRSKRKMPYYPQGLSSLRKVKRNKTKASAFFTPRPSHQSYIFQEYTGYPVSVLKYINDKGFHPTQKPVNLFEYLIKTYTVEGEIVLDNCMGSGTTAIACLNTNRKYIGFEINKEYYHVAKTRIKQHLYTKSLRLFK